MATGYSRNMYFVLTDLLTPWSTVLLEKLTGFQLVKKSPAFYGTQRFTTAFTSTCHLSLYWATLIQSMPPHPTFWRFTLILSSYLCLRLPSGLFPSGFPTKILRTPLLSPICATCPTHLILLDFSTRTIVGEENRSFSFSLCSFIHSLLPLPLRPKYFPEHPSLKHSQPTFLPEYERPSFTPIQNNRKIIVLYTLIFKFTHKCRTYNNII